MARLSRFLRNRLNDTVTAETFRRLIDDPRYLGLVAEVEGRIIGLVHCIFHPVTGSPNGYCYLEDLFVDPTARGKGAGRTLIEAVYAESDRRGCARVYWHTHKDNRVARALYDRLASLSEFVQYRR